MIIELYLHYIRKLNFFHVAVKNQKCSGLLRPTFKFDKSKGGVVHGISKNDGSK